MSQASSQFFGGTSGGPAPDECETAATLLREVVSALERAGHLANFEAAARSPHPQQAIRLAEVHFFSYCMGVFGARQLASQLRTDRVVERVWGGQPVGFRELIEYRDRSNEALALFFTELVVALVDCGLDAFLHTPLHPVANAAVGRPRAQAAAELAVTLLNAAKRRDDIETARYGLSRAVAALPAELGSADGRRSRIQAMLRLRAPEEGDWNQPTQLIDLTVIDGVEGDMPLPNSFGAELASAANEAARSGLLPRLSSSDWEATSPPQQASESWRPDVEPAVGPAPAGRPATGRMAAPAASAQHERRLPDPVHVPMAFEAPGRPLSGAARGTGPIAAQPAAPQARGTGPTPAPQARGTGSAPAPRPSTASAPAPRPQTGSQSKVAPRAPQRPPRKDLSAVAGAWLLSRWRTVIWLLVVVVVVALAMTFLRA
ncbi:MAG: hypothetical protein H6697_00970 [Myxococcales bacterium]|nr:hypothetical protein [Myxococcales bacterium]